jgi:hypothetical protein
MNLVFRFPHKLLFVDSKEKLRELMENPSVSSLEVFCTGVICGDESMINDYVLSRLMAFYKEKSTSSMLKIEPYREFKPLDESERRDKLPVLRKRCIRLTAFGPAGSVAAELLHVLDQFEKWVGELKV